MAPASQNEEHNTDLDSPKDDGDLADKFSLDSRVIAIRLETPRYDLPSDGGERVLVEKENFRKDGEDSAASPDGSGSALSIQSGGDSPISASLVKVIGEPLSCFSRHPRFTLCHL